MERRFDRYKIFYIQKILRGIVPNIGINIRRKERERNGIMIESNKKLHSNQHDFLTVGPKIFNKLPTELRSLYDSMEVFKIKLDQFLEVIPDRPRIGYQTKMHSNSLHNAINEWNYSVKWRTTV